MLASEEQGGRSGNAKESFGRSKLWRHVVLLTLLSYKAVGSFFNSVPPFAQEVLSDPTSVYVPGAGFSGFWFSLGRLLSIPDPRARTYYCFSAGCLGVVAALTNVTVDDVTDIAFDIQAEWKNGDLSRFELAETFVDRLIPPYRDVSPDALERINVFTTTKGKGVNMRRARTTDELKEMLVQTTWIPFATGWGLWKTDLWGQSHMDGGLLMFLHPRCQSQLSLPPMLDLFLNIINPNLRRDQVRKFLDAGAAHGVV